MRVNMIVPDDLLAEIDEKASSLHISRTAWVIMTLSRQLEQDKMIKSMPQMTETIQRALSLEEMRERDAARIEGQNGP